MNRDLLHIRLRVSAPWVIISMLVGQSVAQRHVDISSESRMWIEGSSNVNTFTCTTEVVEGHGVIPSAGTSDVGTATVVVSVGIETLDCGKQGMTRDLRRALKAAEFPEIRFELDSATVDADFASSFSHRIVAYGRLTLAGRERSVDVSATAQPGPNSGYRVTGSIRLQMTDYGIRPPRKALGLIRVKDGIVVHFDIVTGEASSVSTKQVAVRPGLDRPRPPLHQTQIEE